LGKQYELKVTKSMKNEEKKNQENYPWD